MLAVLIKISIDVTFFVFVFPVTVGAMGMAVLRQPGKACGKRNNQKNFHIQNPLTYC